MSWLPTNGQKVNTVCHIIVHLSDIYLGFGSKTLM